MTLRITKQLLQQMRTDLARKHSFAYERVGFVSVGTGKADSENILILAKNYHPVADQNYIRDRYAGARINAIAIREAMQYSLDNCTGVFHIHLHDHCGLPLFSPTDITEMNRLIPSMQNLSPSVPHGAIILSRDAIAAKVFHPEMNKLVDVKKITVVGWPMEFYQNKI